MTLPLSRRAGLVLAFCLAPLAAQDEFGAAPQGPDARTRLRQACEAMAQLPGVAFRTIEALDDAMMRQMREQMGGAMCDEEVDVEGKWSNGLTHASVNQGDDEIVRHRGRIVARAGDGPWKLRAGTTAKGQPLPFVLDPQLTFPVLAELGAKAEVKEHESVEYRGRQCAILGFTLTKGQARDASLSGIVPPIASRGPMIRMPGMGGAMPEPETTVDIAVYVDEETGLVNRLRAKTYQTSPFAGMIRMRVGGGDEEVEIGGEVEEEPAAAGELTYKRGLPKRTLTKNLSLSDFDARFEDHGKAVSPGLDAEARKWLDLGR